MRLKQWNWGRVRRRQRAANAPRARAGTSNTSAENIVEDDESDYNSYKSIDEEPVSESEDNKYLTSKPIPTQNISNTVYVCTKNENRFLDDSMIRKDIVIVDDEEVYISNSYPLTNENGGSLSNSFREYLSTSYNFLKMSFNYLKTI